jgi:hypothetical protein
MNQESADHFAMSISWKNLSGKWDTPRGLALSMLITRIGSPDTLKRQPCGSQAS